MPAVQLGFQFTTSATATSQRVSTDDSQARGTAAERTDPPASSAPSDALTTAAHADTPAPPSELGDVLVTSARADALAHTLRTRCQVPVELTVTDNRRTMLSVRRAPALVEVRLHHMFLQGDTGLWAALADYLFEQDRSAAQHIAHYVAQHREQIRRAANLTPAPPRSRGHASQPAAGVHHDLEEIFQEMNARYFEGNVDAQITWARAPRVSAAAAHRPSAVRRSIKLGSYNSRNRLIRVHPALDAAFVPRFFVEYIVFHEMLHQVVPPELEDGKREMHSARFKAREREFQDYRAALAWERDNLARLLRNRGRRQPRAGRSAL